MPVRNQVLRVAMVAVCAGGLGAAELSPVIPGLHGKHPLRQDQVGEVLISELRCASCHDGLQDAGRKAAPDLRGVGGRVTPGYLRRYLADPAGTHPGTTMPDVLAGESPERRQELSASISRYLVSLEGGRATPEAVPRPEAAAGRDLFHRVGCIACHAPRDEDGREQPAAGDVALGHLPGKYRPGALAAFLFEPLTVRPSGRMPDLNLSQEEAAALAVYLAGPAAPPAPGETPPTRAEIKAGRNDFKAYNCVACHQVEEADLAAVRPGPPLSTLDPTRGCLSGEPGRAPDFGLSEAQVRAIRAALAGPAAPAAPADQIKQRLTQLNCIACHLRDDYGGVPADRDSYFHSTQEALGNESRIPPPLTLIGAKLRPEWMNKVLFDRESIRPYMLTRMPHFGESGPAGLPELFAQADHLEPVDLPVPKGDAEPAMRNGAHLLLGVKGLGCIACHNFNGKESPGMKGLDLMTSYPRLQPSWFYQYMQNPAGFRPGIIMPNYWPGGKAAQTAILDGDTRLQLQALWYNFSLGRSARDPEGLVTSDSRLVVSDQARTYRGRSGIAGYRGIAVGFPGGLNYAFNAQNGALTGIWQGPFINVNWRSQGAGGFSPAARAVKLAQDVAFLQLADDGAEWPLRPTTSQEKPVNPDPLYPRNHGYAFGGYFFDAASIPTFLYRCGEIAIEDRSATETVDGKAVLRRTFRISSPSRETLYFRALTGRIAAASATEFQTPDLRLTIAPARTLLRPTGGGEGEQELLIKRIVPPGMSTYTLDYALLR